MELWLVTVNLIGYFFLVEVTMLLYALRTIIIINFPNYKRQQIGNWLNETINKLIFADSFQLFVDFLNFNAIF